MHKIQLPSSHKNTAPAKAAGAVFFVRWTVKIAVFLVCVFSFTGAFAQKYTISGYVTDAETGDAIIGAVVYLNEGKKGSTTNSSGYYSIASDKDTITFTVSHIGYQSKDVILIAKSLQTHYDVRLKKVAAELPEVKVSAAKNIDIKKDLVVPVEVLENIPLIGGESDVLKSLSLFPGISTGREGSSDLYVRGGTPDQNLILLDGIPVYNATHLGGFFGVFNPKAIRDIEFYKGKFPARYGGRVSSVVDVSIKDGNKEKLKGSAGVGLLTSNLALEGPIKKNESSYLFTARSSYLGLINLFVDKSKASNYFDYWVYDINSKLSFSPGRGKLYFNFYTGRDVGKSFFKEKEFSDDHHLIQKADLYNSIKWGNTVLSSKYVLPFGKKTFLTLLAGSTQYHVSFTNKYRTEIYQLTDTLVSDGFFNSLSAVDDLMFQPSFDFSLSDRHHVKLGAGWTAHQFTNRSNSHKLTTPYEKTHNIHEYYAFVEDDIALVPKLSVNLGCRLSGLFNTNIPVAVEPRVTMYYRHSDDVQFYSSYSVNTQYAHLLLNNEFGLPNDIWFPATDSALPVSARQISAGAKLGLRDIFVLSFDVYHKNMNNLIEYKNGVTREMLDVGAFESQIETGGLGEAYGVEVLLRKSKGRVSGFISYALSWSYRQFKNLNRGRKYPFTYDRRHDIALTLNWRINKKWSLSGNWIFQTGPAITLPVALMPQPDGIGTYPVFKSKNNGRMPNYHRMDIGIERRKTTRKNRLVTWKASIYNAYNRKNPTYLHVRSIPVIDNDGHVSRFKDRIELVSLFSLIPSISFNYEF